MADSEAKNEENKGLQIDYEKLAIHLAPLINKDKDNGKNKEDINNNNKDTDFVEEFKRKEQQEKDFKERSELVLNAFSDIYASFNQHVKNPEFYNQIKDLDVGKKANLLAKEIIEKAYGKSDAIKDTLKSFDEQSVFDKKSGFYIKYIDATNILNEKKNEFE